MQHATDIGSSAIGLRMDLPFAHAAALVRRSIDAFAIEVDDDEVFRLEAPPTHGSRFDQNSLVIQLCAQMATEAVTGDLGRVEDTAGTDNVSTKIRFENSFHT